jgi:LAGLIDADG endonuclease
MKETEMGNRGSKSEILQTHSPKRVSVKEQRVDGSCFGITPKLRCTLMGGASYYQINDPSKQFKFYFSTLQSDKNVQLKPYWVTGFTDAEGTFTIVIDKVPKRKLGWRIQSKFQICLHVRDLPLLLKIKQFFFWRNRFS